MPRYRYGRKRSHRKLLAGTGITGLLLIAVVVVGWRHLQPLLQPHTQLAASKAVTTHIDYTVTTKTYNEPNFSISLPSTWKPMTLPPNTYRIYAWQVLEKGDSQQLQIYEDTIPANYAVNRVLMVEGQGASLALLGQASDNCANFADGVTTASPGVGVYARWQGMEFLCDRSNVQRDVIGTSSTDGINTVVLKSTTGQPHRYFFSFTNSELNPDYSVFYNALQSFHMQ